MLTKEGKRKMLLTYLLSFVISAPATIGYLFFYNCRIALGLGFETFALLSLIICLLFTMCDNGG